MYRLSQKQVDEIIELHEKGVSQRDIAKLRHHGRSTIRNYIQDYYDQRIKKLIEEYNEQGKIQIFTISPIGFWFFLIGIMILIMTSLYHIINL